MSLVFKISPVRKQPYIDYSLWLYDLYNYYFKDNHNGFLVELGVGKTIDWVSMGEDSKILTEQEFKEKYVRGWSNTIELLENGWSGIYVEPITEFLTDEVDFCLCTGLDRSGDCGDTERCAPGQRIFPIYERTGGPSIIDCDRSLCIWSVFLVSDRFLSSGIIRAGIGDWGNVACFYDSV
jgi:hypothetical protein